MKSFRKLSTLALCSVLLSCFTIQAQAMTNGELVNIAKHTKFDVCGGQTLQKIVNKSVKNVTWTPRLNTNVGNLVNIEGNFKEFGSLMAMQFKVNNDKSLKLRLMIVNGSVKSQEDSILEFVRMCRKVR